MRWRSMHKRQRIGHLLSKLRINRPSPRTIERMRAAADPRDATLFSVLAYAGLRPGEVLALEWGDIREQTILVERATSLGNEEDTKTTLHRTVRFARSVARRPGRVAMACGRPADDALVFPNHNGSAWTEPAYQSWRRRAFRRVLDGAGVAKATPYTLRHSFASLLLHEGRSVIYAARQLGHDARLTLTRYGHVMDELEDQPRIDAETANREARVPSQFPGNADAGNAPEHDEARVPHSAAQPGPMELGGLEPPTSWVRSQQWSRTELPYSSVRNRRTL